jgi:hypothetical protein
LFRVFIDEVGTHDLKSSDDPNHRYLGLTGVIMPLDFERGSFTEKLNELKQGIFGTTAIVLHRRELLLARPPFQALTNLEVRKQFDELLMDLIANATYRVVTVVIDKKEHMRRYTAWVFHPYHYCLTVLLERYVQFLGKIGHVGDVLVESRGRKENMQLERAYRYIYDRGSNHVSAKIFQSRLTSRQLKIEGKQANVAGLQLADLIANPSCRSLICEKTGEQMKAEFGTKVEKALKKSKYLRRFDGVIPGWGQKWLP